MKKQEVLEIINKHQRESTDVYSVKSLALFGSVAHDEAGPSSDIDMLVEFYRPVGLFGLFYSRIDSKNCLGEKLISGNSRQPQAAPAFVCDERVGICPLEIGENEYSKKLIVVSNPTLSASMNSFEYSIIFGLWCSFILGRVECPKPVLIFL